MTATVSEKVEGKWWMCDNCGAKIGQIISGRLIVIVRGEKATFPLMTGLTLSCRKCGQTNELKAA